MLETIAQFMLASTQAHSAELVVLNSHMLLQC